MCERLEKGKNLEDIQGLIWKKGKKIIKNRVPAIVSDLDLLPFPDLSLIDINKYSPDIGLYRTLPSMNIIGSRGCPYPCIFCNSEKIIRFRSVDNIIEQMKSEMSKHGIKEYIFYDELINFNQEFCIKLCKEIIKKGIKVSWSANARVDKINQNLLKLMKKAGCWRLLFGIESGVQKNLDFLKKGITLEQIKKTVTLTSKTGIETFGSFIFGIPGETYKEGLKTIKFACSLNLDYANFPNLTPYPGTPLWEAKEKYGKFYTGRSDMHHISFVPFSMTRKELISLKILAYKKFYLRPNYIVKRALRIRSLEDIKRNLRGFLTFSSFKKREFN